MSITSGGRIRWSPTTSDIGVHDVTVKATFSGLCYNIQPFTATDYEDFTVTVVDITLDADIEDLPRDPNGHNWPYQADVEGANGSISYEWYLMEGDDTDYRLVGTSDSYAYNSHDSRYCTDPDWQAFWLKLVVHSAGETASDDLVQPVQCDDPQTW